MPPIDDGDVAALKTAIADSGLSVAELVTTAWASASTYRESDHRGGANGARIRLAPQKDWEVNQPEQLAKVLAVYEGIKAEFDGKGAKKVSIADLIVLGGSVGVEQAAKAAGHDDRGAVHARPHRRDAPSRPTPRASTCSSPRPTASATTCQVQFSVPTEELLVDRAQLLGLSAPEMTVLVGGLRVLGANHAKAEKHGVFTDRPGQLTNDFFVNLLDMGTAWKQVSDDSDEEFVGTDRATRTSTSGPRRAPTWCSARTRSCARWPRSMPATTRSEKFVKDFVKAWTKVMNADRFDLLA